MKRIFKYIIAAAAALMSVACHEELVEVGKPENNSYGVYFETLSESAKKVEMAPEELAVLKFRAYRSRENNKDEDAITVPVRITVSAPDAKNQDAVASTFRCSEIIFDEGETETIFSISFPYAELGVVYNCSVECVDERFVNIYSDKPTAFSFSVARIKWNRLKGKSGEQYGSWTDDIFSSLFGLPGNYAVNDRVEVYEREDKPGFFRLVDIYNPYMISRLVAGQFTEAQLAGNCTPGSMTYIDATDPDKVWIQACSSGARLGADGIINIASRCEEVGFVGQKFYGTLKNGVIRFPADGIVASFSADPNSWYPVNTSEKTVFVLPGYKDYDYSVSLKQSYSQSGNLPVEFTLGLDAKNCRYETFEGKIPDADKRFKALEVARSESAKTVSKSGTIMFSFPKTGIYTLVASVLSEDGQMMSYATSELLYVAQDDDVPVVFSLGVGSSDKYTPKGYNTDTSLELYCYGKDIVSASVAVVSKDEISSQNGLELTLENLRTRGNVNADVLAAINGEGFVTPVTGLIPGTEYLAIAIVSNGYCEKVLTSEMSVKTTGIPLPIYFPYDHLDFYEDLAPADRSGFYGTYNYYAVNLSNQNSRREYIGKVTISESSTPDEQDQQGGVISHVNIKGLFPNSSAAMSFDDTSEWLFNNGLMYSTDMSFSTPVNGELKMGYVCTDGYIYTGNYCLLGGYVADGIIALVSYPEESLAPDYFSGVCLMDKTNSYEAYNDVLLVEESKDDMGIAPKVSVSEGLSLSFKGVKRTFVPMEFSYFCNTPSAKLYFPEYYCF